MPEALTPKIIITAVLDACRGLYRKSEDRAAAVISALELKGFEIVPKRIAGADRAALATFKIEDARRTGDWSKVCDRDYLDSYAGARGIQISSAYERVELSFETSDDKTYAVLRVYGDGIPWAILDRKEVPPPPKPVVVNLVDPNGFVRVGTTLAKDDLFKNLKLEPGKVEELPPDKDLSPSQIAANFKFLTDAVDRLKRDVVAIEERADGTVVWVIRPREPDQDLSVTHVDTDPGDETPPPAVPEVTAEEMEGVFPQPPPYQPGRTYKPGEEVAIAGQIYRCVRETNCFFVITIDAEKAVTNTPDWQYVRPEVISEEPRPTGRKFVYLTREHLEFAHTVKAA